jgi:hypothetical protein
VKFRAGDFEFNASVAESNQAPSPQSGNVLRSMTIQFRAQKVGMHEAAVAEALQRQSGGLFSVGESDEPDVEWRVRESNWTYVGSEPWGVNHHVWRIEEVERLVCDLLRFVGIELQPYDYAEEVLESGVLRLAARALITESELEHLSRLAGPFDVVRVGVSDTPRQMRLTGYVWGERPEGLAVAVACEDVHEPKVTLDGLEGGAESNATFDDLLAALPEHANALRDARHARRRVSDIDAWRL